MGSLSFYLYYILPGLGRRLGLGTWTGCFLVLDACLTYLLFMRQLYMIIGAFRNLLIENGLDLDELVKTRRFLADLGPLRGMGLHSVLPGAIFNLVKSKAIFVQMTWSNRWSNTHLWGWPICLSNILGGSCHQTIWVVQWAWTDRAEVRACSHRPSLLKTKFQRQIFYSYLQIVHLNRSKSLQVLTCQCLLTAGKWKSLFTPVIFMPVFGIRSQFFQLPSLRQLSTKLLH